MILVAFVRGWQHDARSDDPNLSAFRVLLNKTVDYEKSATAPGAEPRPVLGVFVGWRGLSEFGIGDAIANATFWGRQAAGQRVAVGSVPSCSGGCDTTAIGDESGGEARFWRSWATASAG